MRMGVSAPWGMLLRSAIVFGGSIAFLSFTFFVGEVPLFNFRSLPQDLTSIAVFPYDF